MPSELNARVIAVIARMQKIPVDSVTLDKTFQELNIDSLDGINIMFEVENEFGIEIPMKRPGRSAPCARWPRESRSCSPSSKHEYTYRRRRGARTRACRVETLLDTLVACGGGVGMSADAARTSACVTV